MSSKLRGLRVRPSRSTTCAPIRLPPLVQRRDRLEIDERVDHRGEVIGPLEEFSVVEAARILSRRGINCVAVCLMHSYLNNTHERMVRDILEREMPGALISISSEVLPEFREYERSSTTALNAYLAPIVGGYLRRLQDSVTAWNKQTRLWVMQSNGGVASAERTAHAAGHAAAFRTERRRGRRPLSDRADRPRKRHHHRHGRHQF